MDDVSGYQPLTRREARAREAALAAEQSTTVTSEPDPVQAASIAPIEPPAEPIAEPSAEPTAGPRRRALPRLHLTLPLPRRSRAHRRASRHVGRAVRASRLSPNRGSSVGSKLVSFGALIIVGALLVGSSLPVNVITPASSASAADDRLPSLSAGQTVRVSADSVESAPIRDSFEVVSAAQLLAEKFAGVNYSYTMTSGAVRWPLSSYVPVTDGYGERESGFHKGVDFAPAAGTPIYAIADGIAVSSGFDDSGYGNHVVIQHNLGGVDVKSNYAHMILDSSPIVAGQHIAVGDFLGLVGDTGIAYGAHLHFEIFINGVPVDPYAWLRANASDF